MRSASFRQRQTPVRVIGLKRDGQWGKLGEPSEELAAAEITPVGTASTPSPLDRVNRPCPAEPSQTNPLRRSVVRHRCGGRVAGMTSKIAGEPHTPRKSWDPNRQIGSPFGSPRPAPASPLYQRLSSPLHQPLRASHQNPHHRAHPVHLRRASSMRRPGLPDALQPLGRAWASAGAPMHPALPAGHRWCLARHARLGACATSRRGLSQRQGYSPLGDAPLGVFRQLRSHPCPFPAFAGWTLPTIA